MKALQHSRVELLTHGARRTRSRSTCPIWWAKATGTEGVGLEATVQLLGCNWHLFAYVQVTHSPLRQEQGKGSEQCST